MTSFSDPLLWIIFASFVLGILVLVGMALLYLRSYPRVEPDWFWRDLWHGPFGPPDQRSYTYWLNRLATLFGEVTTDANAKREIFWTLLIQSAVSLVVVVFIAILLLLKIVTAEAGLPILAAFGGAAISSGVRSTGGTFRTRPPEPPPPAEG